MLQLPIHKAFKTDVLDLAPVIIAVHDKDHNIVWANKAYQIATGLSLEKIEGKKCFSIWRLTNPCRDCPVSTAIETGKQQEAELTPQNQDHWPITQGSWLSKAAPLRDAGGSIIGAVETTYEITESRQTEEALRQSEEVMRYIIKHDPNAIAVYDRNLHYLAVSDRYLQDYNVAETDVLGKHHYEVFPEMPQRWKEVHQRVLHGATERNEDDCFERPDGSITYNRWECLPWYTADGSIGGMITYTEVTTERKLSEKALRRSETFLKTLLNAIPIPVFYKDRNGRYLGFNEAFQTFFGKTREELIGKTVFDINPPELAKIYQSKDDELFEIGGEQRYESKVKNAHGEVRDVIFNKAVFTDSQGSSTGLIGAILDITERISMEAQLRQAQKMESIGTLASGITHDFNNILSPIIGFTELAMDDIPVGGRAHENLEGVLTAANRAKALVKQILAFSHQVEHELKPLEAQLVVEEALKLIKSSIPKSIEISQKIDKDCGLIMGDPTQFHQIVMNLCTNAYHAMGDSEGKLEVTLSEVRFDIEDIEDLDDKIDLTPGRYLRLSVSDTGHGMTPDIIDRIFEPYYTTKGKDKGTGLGLFVTLGIVKNHGGGISVYSEPGIGTTFHVYLPLMEKQIQLTKIAAFQILQTGSERILLVDDEEPIARMEQQMLRRLGYQVTSMTSSIEALEAFRATHDDFDLVITDMSMPNMTGLKLARKLLKIRSDIPIILCTGFSEGMSEERAALLGIKGLLMKPIPLKDLSGMIRKVLDAGQSET